MRTNNLFLISLLVSLSILITGCVHLEENHGTKPYFPTGKDTFLNTITEILESKLTVEDCYLTVNGYVIIWPHGYSCRETNNTTEILNNTGDVIASVGDNALITGMKIHNPQLNLITEVTFPENIKNHFRFLAAVSINELLPEVHFPTNNSACDVVTLGMAKGTLMVENGYLKVMDRVIIWPYGYTINYKENEILVIDEEGNIAGKVGDHINLMGAGINQFTADSISDYAFPDDYVSYDFFDAQYVYR